MDTNLSMNADADSRKKRLGKLAIVLERWFLKWSDAFPSHPVTKIQLGTYLEALDDLTPEQLELGCREATRHAEQFPKPGHIRKAWCESGFDEQRHERPAYLDEPRMSPEEREEAARYSQAMRELLAEKQREYDREMAAVKAEFSAPSDFYDIEGKLTLYREWLEKEAQHDAKERADGMSPVPRSQAERLAIYLTVPLVERQRRAKRGEWTKLLTNTT